MSCMGQATNLRPNHRFMFLSLVIFLFFFFFLAKELEIPWKPQGTPDTGKEIKRKRRSEGAHEEKANGIFIHIPETRENRSTAERGGMLEWKSTFFFSFLSLVKWREGICISWGLTCEGFCSQCFNGFLFSVEN